MALDRISNFEIDITKKIFSYLSIKEAARTSVVSKNWRHKWTVLPCLVFDDENGFSTEIIISDVLLYHSGSIDSFKLSSRKNLHDGYIEQWLQNLSINSIKEIIVKKRDRYSSSYRISSHLYSCRELTHLELYNCSLKPPLKPPSTSKGFEMLKSLRIRRVIVARDVLEEVISHCPQLEKISLCNLRGMENLKIDAPNVQFLELRDGFDDVVLENTLDLVDVSINRKRGSTDSSTLLKFFLNLPSIERLTLEDSFLECANGSLPEKLPDPILALKFLSISIRLNNLEDISTAMCLLRSSPALQELEISVNKDRNVADDTEEATCNWLNNKQNRAVTQLRVLKVTGFSCVKAELDFIVFLLSSSPALQQLEISFARKVVEAENYSWLFDNQNNIGAFMQLRLVKVTRLSGNKAEVNFIRFVLYSTSPMLEKLTLQPAASAKALWELFKMLGEFINRVSEPADLEFLDPSIRGHESDNSSSSDSDDDTDWW
ncbi:PREDICTED: F-box/FBD/LRR-repeat protein At1g13570-like [Fragaria vesca subsp. vesca]|uniref:F-box/FBD/LRR-repeat protein At1g13570-like n=1 Tax=Fragaria vesca subsp. vesca TaxID=101020 RepID=UPI0002C34755|nr:PREDICTED: F-box/FBD/LRR-repeat protein At1g13570-like [Fragaria vesca subsp. vesca]